MASRLGLFYNRCTNKGGDSSKDAFHSRLDHKTFLSEGQSRPLYNQITTHSNHQGNQEFEHV